MTPTTDLAEKLEAEASNSEIHGTLDAAYLCRQAADTLRKQAEELERCRTALEQNDDLMWRAFKASFEARMAASHADDLVAEYTKSRRYAIVDERMKAAGVEPKQNGEAK